MDLEKTANAISTLWRQFGTPTKVAAVVIVAVAVAAWAYSKVVSPKPTSHSLTGVGQIGDHNTQQITVNLAQQDEATQRKHDDQMIERFRDELEESKRTTVPTFPRKLAENVKVGEDIAVQVTRADAGAQTTGKPTKR